MKKVGDKTFALGLCSNASVINVTDALASAEAVARSTLLPEELTPENIAVGTVFDLLDSYNVALLDFPPSGSLDNGDFGDAIIPYITPFLTSVPAPA